MLLSDLGTVARQERYKDLLREATRERLIRASKPGPSRSEGLYQEAARRIGSKTMGWVCKLPGAEGIPVCRQQLVS